MNTILHEAAEKFLVIRQHEAEPDLIDDLAASREPGEILTAIGSIAFRSLALTRLAVVSPR